MRGFLNEIKNVAINRATNRINNALGSLTSGRGIPRNMGGVFQTNAYNSLARNPFAGETVIYPEDLGSNDQGHYVQFYINEQSNANVNFQGKSPSYAPNGAQLRGGTSTASIKRAPTKRLSSSICMYMPATVGASQNSKYGEVEIGAAVATALAAYKGYQDGTGLFGTAESIMQSMAPTIKENMKEAGKKALDVAAGAKAAIDIARGKVTNNRMEMVFEGVDRRSFSFSFKMMPKSESEAIAVDKIVNMFRFYMAPSFEGSATQSRTFIVPATFDIEYYYNPGKQNKFLNRISTCVLESCNVTYGGERTQFFRPTAGGVHGDGAPPVETSIELNFKELEVITREKIAEGF